MLDGIKDGTHCWTFLLLNIQFSQDSSGDARYMSQGIVVHEYEFRANKRVQQPTHAVAEFARCTLQR
jgi:hypothetical protein